MKKYIIYGLFCPFTDNLHYIGKSTSYMTRPQQHLTESHSEKIQEWVNHLKLFGYTPVIKILADCDDESKLKELESEYIAKHIKEGCYLLNKQENTSIHIMKQRRPPISDSFTIENDASLISLGKYLKIARINSNLTQQELGKKSNTSVGTVKIVEAGKCAIGVDNLRKLLDTLGYNICIQKKDLSFTEVFIGRENESTAPNQYRSRVRH